LNRFFLKRKNLVWSLLLYLTVQTSVFASTVSVSGRQLLVNCSPFLVRGVNYNPVPIADNNQEWAYIYNVCISDFAQMNVMGVNTIRVYFNYSALFDTDGTVNAAMKGNYDRLLSAAAAQGIYVIPNFWVPYNVDYTNATNLSQIETQFAAVINLFKNTSTYPNILMWALGDENNNSVNLSPMNDTQMFQFYQNVIAYEKANADTAHPYTAVLVNNNDINNAGLTGLVTSLDIWSLNVYLSTSGVWNSNVVSAYTLTKPLLITEFGNDAYNNGTGTEDDADQSNFFADVWPNSIGNNLSALNSSNKLLGGCVFEWNDEWWKCGTPSTHGSCGETLSVLPDNYGNEAWFGLGTALGINVSGPRTYRTAFTTLKNYWTNSPYNVSVPVICGTSPTFTPTMTPSPTPVYGGGCVTVLDDFNNGSGATNTFGGTWATSFGSGSGGALNYLAPGYSGFSMQFAYSIAAGSYGECFANLSSTANPTGAGTGTVNISNYGQVTFWVTASVPGAYWCKPASSQTYGGAGYSWWQAPFNATTSWTQVTLNLDSTTFSNPSGNSGTLLQNLQNATQLVFQPQTSGAAYLWIDDINFITSSCLVTSTFTATRTNTPTITATPTKTATQTATNTASNTATQTASNTATSTATQTTTNTASKTSTAAATNTATDTFTSTFSATPSATYTSTASPTVTSTFTSTKTSSPTSTPINTFTPSSTFTASFSPTISNTVTNTFSPTVTATFTNTKVNTATSTLTSTATPTVTLTKTATPSYTPSPTTTSTYTNTATFTVTNTPTETPTGTLSPVLTATSTNSSTSTATATYTPSSTFTITVTATRTFTLTPSGTPSNTNTNTPVNTATPTATSAFTKTPVFTDTMTASFTPSFTLTDTFTATATATSSFTPLPQATATNTFTTTFTPTWTATATPATLLQGPYPNPSQGKPVSIWIQVPKPTTIKWTVYSLAFRKIAEGETSIDQTGTIVWNFKDRYQKQVANGLYYMRVEAIRGQTITKLFKIMLLQ